MAPHDAVAPAPDAIPATLDHASTLAALGTGSVVRWWQVTSFLEIAGPDAPTLLAGLCTQAVEQLAVGEARPGLFLDGKAKIIAAANVHRTPDAAWSDPRRTGDQAVPTPRMLLEVLPDQLGVLCSHLTRYRLRARATIEPVELGTIAVLGPGGDGLELGIDDGWTLLTGQACTTRCHLGSAQDCATLVHELAARTGGLADPDAVEAHRISAGTPSLHDLLPGRMPAEVGGMASAVALDAGCYLGQEPVARLHYRGRANRTLRHLVASSPVQPAGTLELERADAAAGSGTIGWLTTWATQLDGTIVALGVLRRELEAGDELRLAGTDALLQVGAGIDDAG